MTEPGDGDKKVSVLVVEDEPSIRIALCMLLEFHGYNCMQAPNGVEAIAKMDGNPPALVVTDYMMPRMDGLSLAKEIRGNSRYDGVPVILISGIPPPSTVTTDLVDLVMQKPVSGSALTRAIQQVLGGRSDAQK
jgi:CheY-like chemotaxis protein